MVKRQRMMPAADDAEKEIHDKTRFLEATFKEIRGKRAELLWKKGKLLVELAKIQEKVKITKEKEKQLVNNLKGLQRIEAKLEDTLNDEGILTKEEEVTEEKLASVQKKLAEIKRLYETLQNVEET